MFQFIRANHNSVTGGRLGVTATALVTPPKLSYVELG